MRTGSPALALLVLALPAASFLVIGLVPPLRRAGRLAAAVSVAAMGGALTAAVIMWQAARAILDGPPRNPSATWSWIPADGGPMATVGVMVDDLAMPMCVLVTFISFLVQVYSYAYLHDEAPPSLGRYYAYQSLFAFSMLGLVLAPGF
jgi:NADH-quinone oxidoreductase subunit L